MQAGLISIGDELISGKRVNTNSVFIASKLNQVGIFTQKIISVGDGFEEISSAFKYVEDTKIIIVTGGLGPTSDDITVEAFAKILKQQLVTDCSHYYYLKSIQSKDNKNPRLFLKQANKPIDFILEKSIKGSAPFLYYLGKQKIFLLPGVPEESQYLLEEKVIPLLKKESSLNKKQETVVFKFAEIRELEVEKVVEEIFSPQQLHLMKIGYLPQNGELTLSINYPLNNFSKNDFLIVLQKLSHNYIGNKDIALSEYVHLKLLEKKLKIGFVESCTGGLLTHSLIQYSGSSAYLDSSIVSYSNDAKEHLVSVEKDLIKRHGAVSEEVVSNMSNSFFKKRNLDISVAISGVAGPNQSELKPVGLVYIAISSKLLKKTIVDKNNFRGSRQRIQQRTVVRTLFLIWKLLNGDLK